MDLRSAIKYFEMLNIHKIEIFGEKKKKWLEILFVWTLKKNHLGKVKNRITPISEVKKHHLIY